MSPIAVIDTGICNLRSVTKALEAVGAVVRVVRNPGELAAAGAAGVVRLMDMAYLSRTAPA